MFILQQNNKWSLCGREWGGDGGGCLFEAWHLLTFSAFRMGAYSRLGAYSNKYGSLPVSARGVKHP